MRTTSLVEAINSIIQRSFPDCTHIFKFVESLKFFDSIKACDLHQISNREITAPKLLQKRAIDRARDEKIQRCTAALNSKEISVAKFLEEVAKKEVLPSISM